MVEYKSGDILVEDCEALVNSVNCVGVMGRGVALQFKKAFPENFKAYAKACKRKEVLPGQMFVFETGQLSNPRYIINFPTKRHWRSKSRIDDIEAGLKALTVEVRTRGIRSIAVPPLGSGLGGLYWDDVHPRIEAALCEMEDLRVVLFAPGGGPTDQRSNRSSEIPNMTAGRAVLIGLIDRYLRGFLDPFVTLLEVHKLMYFMQVAREPLRLKFAPHVYGPYAENLRHVLRMINGHFIMGYGDGGDRPDCRLDLVPGAVGDADEFLADNPETFARFEKVVRLVEGFESSFGLELLATVHWVAAEHPAASEDEIIERTYAWNERKRQFSERQIRLALGVLRDQDWLEAGSAAAGA